MVIEERIPSYVVYVYHKRIENLKTKVLKVQVLIKQ